jgi:hypothetical protein
MSLNCRISRSVTKIFSVARNDGASDGCLDDVGTSVIVGLRVAVGSLVDVGADVVVGRVVGAAVGSSVGAGVLVGLVVGAVVLVR